MFGFFSHFFRAFIFIPIQFPPPEFKGILPAKDFSRLEAIDADQNMPWQVSLLSI